MSSSLLGRADGLAAGGEYAHAHALYAQAVQKRIPGAHERLCHTEALLGRDVLACTAAALKLNPASAFLYSLDGQEALSRGLSERAAASYERAVLLQPADADTLTNTGIALGAAGRAAEAIDRLRAALAIAPEYVSAHVELARLHEACEGTEDACTFDAAVHARAHAARLSPTSFTYHLDLGNTLLQAQRPTEAATALQRALNLAPGIGWLQALAYFGLGRAALGRGGACEARHEFACASSLAPDDVDSWQQHGLAAQRCLWEEQQEEEEAGASLLPERADELAAEAKKAWRHALLLEPRRSDCLTMYHLAPPSASPLVRLPDVPSPAAQWSVSAAGTPSVAAAGASAEDLTVDFAHGTSWRSLALDVLRRNGALRLTNMLTADLALQLAADLDGSSEGRYDTTNTTQTNRGRRHVAVPLRLPAVAAVLDSLAPSLQPLLCAALEPTSEACDALRIVESGLLTSSPGARAQPLHTDTAQSASPHEARALKLQLGGAADISADMGPLEVVPASVHSPPTSAKTAAALPLPLPQGSAVVYDTRTWHRGGKNRSRQPRPIYYLTVVGSGAPPAGLPYTIEPTEVGCFLLTPTGVVARRTRRCNRLHRREARHASSAE